MTRFSRLIVPLLVLAVAALAVASAEGVRPPPPPPPGLVFDHTSHDFGTQAGSTLVPEHAFVLTYAGKGTSGRLSTDVAMPEGSHGYAISADTCAGTSLSARNPTCSITVTYTRHAPGTDTARVTAAGRTLQAGVDLRAESMNFAPTAGSPWVPVTEDTLTSITLTGLDLNGDALTFAIVAQPSNGTLGALGTPTCDTEFPSTCTVGVDYTPDDGYTGPDSFTFKANDGWADSENGTVSIDVTSSNQAPTADDNWADVTREVATPITLSGGDADGDELSFSIVDSPDHGMLGDIATPFCSGTVCTADVTYTPDFGYIGTDSFTFVTNDGKVESQTAGTISITVSAPPNQEPWAEDLPNEGYWAGGTVTLRGGDPDGDSIDFFIVTQPDHGSLGEIGSPFCDGVSGFGPLATGLGPMLVGSVCTLEVSYTPEEGYEGEASFTYKASDGDLDSNIATVTFTGPS